MDTSKLIFYISVAAVCAIITLFVKNRPRYFLFLMVFFAPFSTGIIFRHINGIFLMDIPLFILLIYGIFSNRRFKIYFGIPAIALIIWSLLSGFNAVRFDVAFSEITRLIRAYLAFLCIINFTKTKGDFYAVLYAFLVSLGLMGLLGFFQWRHGSLGLTFLGEAQFSFRARGLFTHPAMLADYLVILIPIALRLLVFYKPEKKKYTIILGIIFTLSLAALFGTYARGTWIGFAGAVIIMLLYTLFKKRFYPKLISAFAFMVLIASVVAVHYVPTIVSQFTSDYRSQSTQVRMPLITVASRVVKDNLFLGVGPGNYVLNSHRYVTLADATEWNEPYDQLCQIVHNSYLLIAAEVGIPGIFLFILILFNIFKTGMKVLKIKNSLISNIGLGILTGYLALLIAMLAGPDYTQHQIMMVFWIVAGYLVALSKLKIKPKKKRQKFVNYKNIEKVNYKGEFQYKVT